MPPYGSPDNGSPDSGAADALEQGQGQGDQSGDKGYTCYLPSDFPGADTLKAGDTITLKVVGKDSDGDLEVAHAGEDSPEGKGMMDNFDKEVS
jgi:hypothetical protein